ncbi:DUF3592 domain-containing protein [Streptomyces justiciae]|uniref:DUF3592 domain-containing protein n=1 Tax=Streptomyces justiciae TaxID=2780140 RepID=A0ABU3LKJ7_9ACTN|nr:DUF3592 domain-containing protein [Streptomyces justiciae]MDT7839774.1 DUF3592 domain-containing protein [Streptomyces justiciae]
MGWDGFLLLWCAAWGVAALVGYGMSLAGVTKAQRTVRLAGRIERVREPRHGGSRKGGISVVVSYRDPDTGEQVTVTNDGERGEMITVAWEGREIGVSHPRGRPHAYRFSNVPEEPSRGLGWPTFALFLVYVGLVVLAAVDRGWPWALIGFGGPWAVYAVVHLPATIRARNDHVARLAAMETAEGSVVAVLKDVSVDQDDGHTWTTITPVVSFTTREGTVVTAHCTEKLPNAAEARGRDVTVHYAPADPAHFTLNRSAEQRSRNQDVTFNVLTIVVLAATAVVGVAFL